jgi:threonine 3-dehydrogenase
MLALRKTKLAPGLELMEIDIPKPRDDELLVNVKACSMCGTDVHIADWDPPWSGRDIRLPRTIGHEVCGEVVDKGKNVKSLEIGDSVSAESHIPCWKCFQCKIGNAHICENLKFFGLDLDGFFAEYAIIPESNAWKNPKDMRPEIATLQESMGNSVYTVSTVNVAGKNVAIFGMGPTGLFATAICRAEGASKIICIAGTELHIQLAKRMGAHIVIDRHQEDPVKAIRDLTDGRGVDIALEMSGSPIALQQSLEATRPVGHVAVLGLSTRQVPLDVSKQIVLKDINLRGVYGRKIWDTWVTTSRFLQSGVIDISPVITHRIRLEDYNEGMNAMKAGRSGKVVIFPKL